MAVDAVVITVASAGFGLAVAKVDVTAKIVSAAECFLIDFCCSPTKLVKLIKPILQFFSSGSSPGPGILASLDTSKKNLLLLLDFF